MAKITKMGLRIMENTDGTSFPADEDQGLVIGSELRDYGRVSKEVTQKIEALIDEEARAFAARYGVDPHKFQVRTDEYGVQTIHGLVTLFIGRKLHYY